MAQLFSGMFRLNLQDLVKGIATAVLAAVLGGLQQLVSAHGFDFSHYDWNLIGTLAMGAFTGYLSKNFLSDESGKVLGKIG